MTHPYSGLGPEAFWKSAVAGADPAALAGIWTPKAPLGPGEVLASAGSCFAQHLGPWLAAAGAGYLDVEPAPRGMSAATARRFGYGLFSARYGNVYTARQFVQLLEDALHGAVDPAHVWDRDGRFFDALRPGVEPEGAETREEVLLLRRAHLDRVADLFTRADVTVLTLGMTEAWVDRADGRVFPSCPGVIAGRFEAARHAFTACTTAEVARDIRRALELLRTFRSGARMVLTVSPVPLAATASGGHVLAANTLSKAILRAAAGEVAQVGADAIDYFPSYEIVMNPAARGRWLAEDGRGVAPEAVAAVMRAFLGAQSIDPVPPRLREDSLDADPETEVCEDLLLQAFAP